MTKATPGASAFLNSLFDDGRAAAANARAAADTMIAGGEILQAAGEVITARLELLAAGMVDPERIDADEIALMSAEKIEAATAATAALARNLGQTGERLARDAVEETRRTQTAMEAIGEARTASEALAAQLDWTLGWWSRAGAQAMTLNAELLKAQAEAMKPVHDAALANARRLKR